MEDAVEEEIRDRVGCPGWEVHVLRDPHAQVILIGALELVVPVDENGHNHQGHKEAKRDHLPQEIQESGAFDMVRWTSFSIFLIRFFPDFLDLLDKAPASMCDHAVL